ncbi:GNAT family N-acetyltransferase [candidate division KSB1 bacterium]|nr:GNAT family N-acetyltransferase [candidate division KSB1 bacterium]
MIRLALSTDAQQLQALYIALHPNDPLISAEDFQNAVNNILESSTHFIFVKEIDGRLVAPCFLNIIPNLTRGLRPYAVVENVFTLSTFRKQGHATKLLHVAFDKAKEFGCYKVMLMTGSKEVSTLHFYENAGFSKDVKTAFLYAIP